MSYYPYMPWKDKEKQREAIRQHYAQNRQYYIDKASKKRRDIREWVYKLKESSPCKDCGVYYPYYVMDFDHLEDKKILISRVINSGSWSQTKAEIVKCDIVCSNCHRIRTYARIKEVNGV